MNLEINLGKLKKYFILKYGIIICVVCFFAACQSRNHNLNSDKTYTLTIVCDSSFNRNLLYDFYLFTKDDTIKIQKIKYDSLNKITTFKWDSLRNEEYHFEIISVFQQKSKVSFILNRDTTIRIRNNFKYELNNIISKATLLKSDTICFAFQTTGCSYGIAIYTLTKNNGKYRLKGSKRRGWDPIDKDVLPEIINDLYQIQISCRNHKLHEYGSTRAYQFMLLSDKKVFYFDDMYSGDDQLYSIFKDKYIYKRQN